MSGLGTKMVLQIASCDKQYEKFPQLIRSEVLKLQDWYNRQSHTPNITGKYYTKTNYCFIFNVSFLSRVFISSINRRCSFSLCFENNDIAVGIM